MEKSTIKRVYDKSLEKVLREMIIQIIADDSAYWEYDFDRDEYKVPHNWDGMSMEEKAEYVYSNTAWSLDDWLEYYQIEFE